MPTHLTETVMSAYGAKYKYDSHPSGGKGMTMPPGVPHPQAGQPLGPYTERCPCGGITGTGGTPQGASKWRSHIQTTKVRLRQIPFAPGRVLLYVLLRLERMSLLSSFAFLLS